MIALSFLPFLDLPRCCFVQSSGLPSRAFFSRTRLLLKFLSAASLGRLRHTSASFPALMGLSHQNGLFCNCLPPPVPPSMEGYVSLSWFCLCFFLQLYSLRLPALGVLPQLSERAAPFSSLGGQRTSCLFHQSLVMRLLGFFLFVFFLNAQASYRSPRPRCTFSNPHRIPMRRSSLSSGSSEPLGSLNGDMIHADQNRLMVWSAALPPSTLTRLFL